MNEFRFTFEGDIENLTGLKGLGVINPIKGKKHLLRRAKLLSNPLDGVPRGHDVRIVHHTAPSHRIAATRQRYPQRIPSVDLIRIRNLISHLDLLVLHHTREHAPRNRVEAVTGFDLVQRHVVREPRVVAAPAGERHLHGHVGGHFVTARRVAREGVGVDADDVGEVLHVEQLLDVAQGGAVLAHVVDEGVTRGVLGAALELGLWLSPGQEAHGRGEQDECGCYQFREPKNRLAQTQTHLILSCITFLVCVVYLVRDIGEVLVLLVLYSAWVAAMNYEAVNRNSGYVSV